MKKNYTHTHMLKLSVENGIKDVKELHKLITTS